MVSPNTENLDVIFDQALTLDHLVTLALTIVEHKLQLIVSLSCVTLFLLRKSSLDRLQASPMAFYQVFLNVPHYTDTVSPLDSECLLM